MREQARDGFEEAISVQCGDGLEVDEEDVEQLGPPVEERACLEEEEVHVEIDRGGGQELVDVDERLGGEPQEREEVQSEDVCLERVVFLQAGELGKGLFDDLDQLEPLVLVRDLERRRAVAVVAVVVHDGERRGL